MCPSPSFAKRKDFYASVVPLALNRAVLRRVPQAAPAGIAHGREPLLLGGNSLRQVGGHDVGGEGLPHRAGRSVEMVSVFMPNRARFVPSPHLEEPEAL